MGLVPDLPLGPRRKLQMEALVTPAKRKRGQRGAASEVERAAAAWNELPFDVRLQVSELIEESADGDPAQEETAETRAVAKGWAIVARLLRAAARKP